MVLGSDGLWDFLSCQSVVETMRQQLDPSSLPLFLRLFTLQARAAWEDNESGYVDDITCMLVLL